jgi:hypothetical protein
LVLGALGWGVWKLFVMKEWVEDVEYEGNVDANEALESLEGDEDKKKEDGKEKEDGKAKGKKGKGGEK